MKIASKFFVSAFSISIIVSLGSVSQAQNSSRAVSCRVAFAGHDGELGVFQTDKTVIRPAAPSDAEGLTQLYDNQLFGRDMSQVAPPQKGQRFDFGSFAILSKGAKKIVGHFTLQSMTANAPLVRFLQQNTNSVQDFKNVREGALIELNVSAKGSDKTAVSEAVEGFMENGRIHFGIAQYYAKSSDRAMAKILKSIGFTSVGKKDGEEIFEIKTDSTVANSTRTERLNARYSEPAVLTGKTYKDSFAGNLKFPIVEPSKTGSQMNRVANSLAKQAERQSVEPYRLATGPNGKPAPFFGLHVPEERMIVVTDNRPSTLVHEARHKFFRDAERAGRTSVFSGWLSRSSNRQPIEEMFTYALNLRIDRGTRRWSSIKGFVEDILAPGPYGPKDYVDSLPHLDLQVFEDAREPATLRMRDRLRKGEIAVSLFTDLPGVELLKVEVKTDQGTADLLFSSRDPRKFLAQLKAQTFAEIGANPDLAHESWQNLYAALSGRLSLLSEMHSRVRSVSETIEKQMESGQDETHSISELVNLVRGYAKVPQPSLEVSP